MSCKVAETKAKQPCICGYVLNRTKRVVITVERLKEVFQLGHREKRGYNDFVTERIARSVLPKIGYPETELNKTIKLKFFKGIWNLLITFISKSLQMKTGGFDTPNATELQIFHSMLTNNQIDYAQLIFDEMVVKVNKKINIVPFVRIFGVMIENCINGDFINATGCTVEFRPIAPSIYNPKTNTTPLLSSMVKSEKKGSAKGTTTDSSKVPPAEPQAEKKRKRDSGI